MKRPSEDGLFDQAILLDLSEEASTLAMHLAGDGETAAIAAELVPPRIAGSSDGDPPEAGAAAAS